MNRLGNRVSGSLARWRLAAALFSLIAVSLLVVRGSDAVFSDATDNTANTWNAGTVTLANDPENDGTFGDATTAEFTASTLIPGDTGTGCIDVRYDGTVTAGASLTNVVLYTANLIDTDGGSDAGDGAKLSDDLDLVVNVYGAGEDCSTAVPTKTEVFASAPLDTMPASYATGVDSGWKPAAGGEVRAFEFAWTLGADTANDAQGDAAQIDFVWEIQTS
jgi:hypothetical protein